MSVHPPSLAGLRRLFAAVLILCILLPSHTPVQADDDILALVKQFETTLKATPGGSRDAALKVLEKYQTYKHLATGSTINRGTVKALDEHLISMCKETWRDVAVNQGPGLSHVVPVGTLGTRNTGGNYIPGKSDKDFIPQGSGASQAVNDFNSKFSKKFKIIPETVDVNVLDPTRIETWPDRVLAATNAEKYNTQGGIKWLEQRLYAEKPNLWRYDTVGEAVGEIPYKDMVKGPPPVMTAADSLGFASDNLRFRNAIVSNSELTAGEIALKSAKYDMRTVNAFGLAGGKLNAEEKALVEMTLVFQKLPGGTLDSAVTELARRTGQTREKALQYYLEGMEKLNTSMTRRIAETYLDLMGPGKTTAKLTNELASALSNLPPSYAAEVEGLAAKKLGAGFSEVKQMADAFKLQLAKVRYGTVYFNEQSLLKYGKTYDQISDAQKAALHGAEEVTEASAGFLSKALKVAGYGVMGAFVAFSVYDAYQRGGAGSAGKELWIQLLQAGYTPLMVGEMVVRLTAGITSLGASAYKNDVLNTLYAKFLERGDIAYVLNTLGPQHYNAGGLRELAKEMRAENPNMTDAEIDQAIARYFTNRKKNEDEKKQFEKTVSSLEEWIKTNNIQLSEDELVNENLKKFNADEYNRILGLWLYQYKLIEAQLIEEGVHATSANIHFLVSRKLYGTPQDFLDAMNAQRGKPVAKTGEVTSIPQTPCKGIACIKFGAFASIQPKTIPANPGVIWSGGGGFASHGWPCDSAQKFGPFEIAGGAKMKAEIKGSPPVKGDWSMGNFNTGMMVLFSPRIGSTYGAAEKISSLRDVDAKSDLSEEFNVPGAGKLSIVFTAPIGQGVYNSECFGQGYSAKVQALEMKTVSDAHHGTAFNAGDKISTAGSPVVMLMADGTKLEVQPGSAVSFDQDSSGQPVVRLEKGRMQFTSPHQGSKPIVVKVGNKTITRKGTDFIVFNDGYGQGVSVLDGSVTVTGEDGTQTEIGKGKEMDLSTGTLTDYTNPDDNRTRMHNLRLQDVFIGDAAPEPAGAVTAPTTASPPDGGWVWQDPGYDSTLEVSGGQVKMTVPHGKCIGTYCDNSPVLMHKVSGDFDLQTRALLLGPNDRWVTLDFILYSPDSYLGVTADQVKEDSLFAHTRLVGAGWNRDYGTSKLKFFNKPISMGKGGQEVPDAPVLLRLTRRGDLFRTYWSTDGGSTWNLSAREQFTAPETLYTGWTAIYGGESPGTPKFATTTLEGISLTSAPLNSLPQPAWDFVSREGSGSGSGKTVSLALDGSKIGETWAHRSEVLPGDFEVIASYNTAPWTQQAGESRGFNLMVESVDGVKMVYVGAFQNDGYGYQFHTNYVANEVPQGSWNRMDASGTSGKLRLVRKDGVITAYIYKGGQWVQIDKGYEPITDPVFPAVQIYNTFDAKIPAALKVDFTIEKLTGQTAGTTTTTNESAKPVAGGVTPAAPAKPAVPEEPAGASAPQSFSDDFSSSANTWKIAPDVNNGTLAVKGGKLNLKVTKPDKYLFVPVPWNLKSPVTDVTLAATVTVGTPGLGSFGLLCRAADTKNFYMVFIQPKTAGGGEYRFYKAKAGTPSIYLTDWKTTNTLIGGEVPEEIVFSCKGSMLRLELNRKFVDEITDTDLKSGGAYLFALSLKGVTESNPYKIAFDDFKATTP